MRFEMYPGINKKMSRPLVLFGALLLLYVAENSVAGTKSEAENYDEKAVFSEGKPTLNYTDVLPSGSVRETSTLFRSQYSADLYKKNQRRIRVRKWKEKGGKFSRQKNKPRKLPQDLSSFLRNHEKVNLVRNKTIEILKSGFRILSAGENFTGVANKSVSQINESLLEKILSSAASKQDVLLSASGAYKLPVGFRIYESKAPEPATQTLVTPLSEQAFDKQQIKRQSKNQTKISGDDYDYEYDLLTDFHVDTTNDSLEHRDKVDPSIPFSTNKVVGALLEVLVHTLRNSTNCSNGDCYQENDADAEDPCQKWLNCRESLNRAFLGSNHGLPSCPCIYPSSIFYDEMIWDRKQKKYFRWRDASGDAERLDIYKPGAAYCIRSLLTQGSLSLSSQQCCYDRSSRLLTRGSGAGTVNFISPDVSKKLHYTADVLPWRLCKGDFTRYNIARNPNNGNDCPENPDEQQYQLQVKLSKIF